MSYGLWGNYMPVAVRQAQAAHELARLRKAGQRMSPVKIAGRAIAKTVWGKAWCGNLDAYQHDANRLPRGRTYVRNGSVVDLQITPSLVKAMVAGSSMYRVSVTIAPLPVARWNALCRDCAGSIDSLVELLQGRLPQSVMERLCRPTSGLFPERSEIKLSCSCPDSSGMCKHVAAALYGVGARLDEQPDLLFRLRAIDAKALVGLGGSSLPFLATGAIRNAVSAETDLSALFGLDIATPEVTPTRGTKTPVSTRPKARATPITDPPSTAVKSIIPVSTTPAARSKDKTPLEARRDAVVRLASEWTKTPAPSGTRQLAAKAATTPVSKAGPGVRSEQHPGRLSRRQPA